MICRHLLDVFQEVVGVTPSDEPWDNGAEGADDEEEHQSYSSGLGVFMHQFHELQLTIVGPSLGEHFRRANDTPNDGGGAENFGAWADEAIFLGGRAHVTVWFRRSISHDTTSALQTDRDTHVMLVNIHACTPSCTVPAMTVAMIWHQNIGLGGIFM